jgi:hypothetical protein
METNSNVIDLEDDVVKILGSIKDINNFKFLVNRICKSNKTQFFTNVITPVSIKPLPNVGYYCKGNILPKSL